MQTSLDKMHRHLVHANGDFRDAPSRMKFLALLVAEVKVYLVNYRLVDSQIDLECLLDNNNSPLKDTFSKENYRQKNIYFS